MCDRIEAESCRAVSDAERQRIQLQAATELSLVVGDLLAARQSDSHSVRSQRCRASGGQQWSTLGRRSLTVEVPDERSW